MQSVTNPHVRLEVWTLIKRTKFGDSGDIGSASWQDYAFVMKHAMARVIIVLM